METIDSCPDCIEGYSDERLDTEINNSRLALDALVEHIKTLEDERHNRWRQSHILKVGER